MLCILRGILANFSCAYNLNLTCYYSIISISIFLVVTIFHIIISTITPRRWRIKKLPVGVEWRSNHVDKMTHRVAVWMCRLTRGQRKTGIDIMSALSVLRLLVESAWLVPTACGNWIRVWPDIFTDLMVRLSNETSGLAT